LRNILPKSNVLLCVLLLAKGLNAKDIYKEIFLFTVGGVCRVERFTTGSRNVLKDVRKSQMMPDQAQKWLRQQSKVFYAEFRRTRKAMGQVYQCWWRICREIDVSSRFEYHMFYVLYPFVTYLLTDPRILHKIARVIKSWTI
jgi:hypothetical protein